jgi:hypothetical protein
VKDEEAISEAGMTSWKSGAESRSREDWMEEGLCPVHGRLQPSPSGRFRREEGTMSYAGSIGRAALMCIIFLAIVFLPTYSAAQLPAGAVGSNVGVYVDGMNNPAEVSSTSLALMAKAGISYVNMPFYWPNVERTPGTYTFDNFDPIVAAATSVGLKVHFNLWCFNPAYDNGYAVNDNAGYQAFTNYALASVAHYQGQGVIWEICWNPDTMGPSAANYASLVAMASAAIKAKFPQEAVVAPSVSTITSYNGLSGTLPYFQDLAQQGTCKNLDGLSAHLTSRWLPAEQTEASEISQIRAAMSSDPSCAKLPIVPTEAGYPSALNFFNPTDDYAQSEADEGKWDIREILYNLSAGAPYASVWQWRDGGTSYTNANAWEDFGLLTYFDPALGVPTLAANGKPAYTALRTMISQLKGYTYATTITTSDPTDFILRFSNGTASSFVCWNMNGTANVVSIPVGTPNEQIFVTNFDGSSVTNAVTDLNGNYSCTETDAPQYISAVPVVTQVAPTMGLTSSPSGSTGYGQSVTFTATVTGTSGNPAPTGSVQFSVGSTILGSPQLTGSGTSSVATVTVTTLPVGDDTVTATYSGDAAYLGSTATTQININQSITPTITMSSSPSGTITPGQAVTLTATVAQASGDPVPTGSMQFALGSTAIGSSQLNGSGMATLPVTSLPVGIDTITATYSGDSIYNAGSASEQIKIAPSNATFAGGPVPTGIGISDHNLNEGPNTLALMHGIGIRYIRIDLDWAAVEKAAGVYDFSAYDPFVSRASNAGLKVLFILDYSNPLYDGGYSPYDATGDTAYANFAKAAVTHYQGKGVIWEIYNEPQNFWTSPGGTLSPTNDAATVAPLYSAMAVAAESAIKSAFPNETVIGPASGWFDSGTQPNWSNTQTFLNDIFQVGVGQYLDAISVHAYRTVPETAPADYGWLQQQMIGGKITDLPIASSEWGYATTNTGGSEQVKAQLLARMLLVNMMNNIPLSIIYDWMDDGTDTTNVEDNYGMVENYNTSVVDPQITPLPAFNAVQTLTSQLNGYTYANRISTGNSTDYVLEFTNGSDTRYVCWNSAGTANVVNIPVPSNETVTITSFDGTQITTATSGASGYYCTESAGPQYITISGSSGSGSSSSAPDFTLTSNNYTLLIAPGNFTTAQLTITPSNLFTSAVALSCGSLPAYISCSFSPTSVTPSGTQLMSAQLKVSVAATTTGTSTASAAHDGRKLQLAILLLGPLCLVPLSFIQRNRWRSLSMLVLLGIAFGCTTIGCQNSPVTHRAPSGTYTINVTATAGSKTQTIPITIAIVTEGQ